MSDAARPSVSTAYRPVDHAIVPQSRGRIVRMALTVILCTNGCGKCGLVLGAPALALGLQASRRTRASTLAACSPPITLMRVGPHPQEGRIRATAHTVVAGAEAPPMITVAWDLCAGHRRTILAPLAMPSFSYLRPTMKPVMFCRNTSGTCWQQSSMKWVPLRADSENECRYGDDSNRHAPQVRKPPTMLFRNGLPLLKFTAINEARDDLAHVNGRLDRQKRPRIAPQPRTSGRGRGAQYPSAEPD